MIGSGIGFVLRYRRWVVAIVLLVTALLATQIHNLRIVIDPASLLPQAHPNVIGTTLAEKLFGSKYVIVVGVAPADGGTALRPDVIGVVRDLTVALAAVPGVKRHTLNSVAADRAKSILGVDGELQVEPLLSGPVDAASVEVLRTRLAANPIYTGTLLSADATTASVSFSVDITERGFREVVDRVLAVVDARRAPGLVVSATGTPVFFAAVERYSQRMGFLFPIALVLIGLLHFEAFRTIQGMLLPLVTALLAVVWVLGIMGAVRLPMDAFNATTPILVLAVAAGHAVQILKRYYEEYDRLCAERPGAAPAALNDAAIVASLVRVGPVTVTAALVAAAGFFSLLAFDILTVRNFGTITGLGILVGLTLELTFIPALRGLLRPPAPRKVVAGDGRRHWDRITDTLAALATRRSGTVIAVFAVLAAACAAGVATVNRENSTKSYFGEGVQVRRDDARLNAHLAGTNTIYVVFAGDRADRAKDPALLALVEDAQRFIETLPDVGKTVSLVDLLKQMNRAMNGGAQEQFRLPSSSDLVSQYLLLYSMSGNPTDFDAYVDYDYRNVNLVVWTRNDSSRYAEDIVRRIRAHVGPRLPPGVRLEIGGSVPQTSALSETLVRSKALNIAQMIGVVFVAGVVVFRSLLGGVLLVVPLLVTVLANFGVMGLTGIPLNTPNSVSSAMAIGIGADYTIYLMYRFREELARRGDFDAALAATIGTAGKAVVYVATAVAGGYSVLMLSFGFYVHIWFGLLIVLSMVVSAVTSLTLVPALLVRLRPRFLGMGAVVAPRPAAAGTAVSLLVALGALAGLAGLAGGGRAQAATPPGADELMTRSYQSSRYDASTSNATFRMISASGQERVRRTFAATKLTADGLRNRRVIRFLSPGDVRNTVTLLVENEEARDEIWVYLPALKKARRLASSGKNGSFVGTDLTYGDVVGHRPQDWTHKLTGRERVDGVEAWVVESVPARPEVGSESGYSRRVSWIAPDSHVPLKIVFSDPGGAPLKTLVNSKIERVDPARDKWQAMTVVVKNHQTGHTTEVTMERLDVKAAVADDLFTVRYLEREE